MPTDADTKDPNAQGTQAGDGADVKADAAKGDGEADDTKDAGSAGEGKTFTQAELDAIVNGRVSRAVKEAKKQAMTELQEKQKREGMDEVERIKAEKADADARAEKLQAENRRLLLRTQLAGKVVDLDDAVAVLTPDFIDDDDRVDVDAFLAAKPHMSVQSVNSKAAPGNPAGTKRLTREQIAAMSEKEIEARWDEVQAVLSPPT